MEFSEGTKGHLVKQDSKQDSKQDRVNSYKVKESHKQF
jgi:hypothetical protein